MIPFDSGIFLWPSIVFAVEIQSPFMALDAANVSELPKNFRTTEDALPAHSKVSTFGLKELHAIGSGQFSSAMLDAVLKKLPQGISILDVDLRQETHGFVNGNAVSLYGKSNWANLGKANQQIQAEERVFVNQLKRMPQVTVSKIDKKSQSKRVHIPSVFPVKTASSEADLVKQYHVKYERIYVTDHCKPADEKVDQFIRLVKKMPKNTWLYFHCRAGVGRTTTFMSMYDMLRNAKIVSYEDILKRQRLIGGKDFLKLSEKPLDIKRDTCAKERSKFLKSFYEYARINQGNDYATSWMEWLKKAH